MVEVTVQFTSPMSDSIREIANKQFEGSLPAVLNAALQSYLNIQTRKREQLKKVVQQIRQEVENQGGIDEEDLEHRIKAYRRTKYSKPL